MKIHGELKLNTLILDTATEDQVLCLKTDSSTYDASSRTGFTHSSNLLPALDDLLAKAQITIKDINLIGCGIGPGSFTGIRISVTSSRMISQLTGAKLVGIKSQILPVINTEWQSGELVLVSYDAKKNRVFGALYKITDNILSPEVIVPAGDYPIHLLKDATGSLKTTAIGSGSIKYSDELKENCAHIKIEENFEIDAQQCCLYVENKFNVEGSLTYNELVPFYARKSDAEAMKDLKKKL
jgi:tRNA threonylcarbamoyladenosine biosynthesis protein TsaB